MLTFLQCSPLLFSVLQLLQYFLCLSAIYCVIKAFRQHLSVKYKFLFFVNLTLQYFAAQLLLEYANAQRVNREIFPLGKILDWLPWWITLLWFAFWTGFTVVSILRIERHNARHVTPQVIKTSLDTLPTALCFSRDDGSVILSNQRMNDFCLTLTGNGLLNANLLWQAIRASGEPGEQHLTTHPPCHCEPVRRLAWQSVLSEPSPLTQESDSVILRLENTVWNISRTRLHTDIGPVWEISAADVSEEYSLIQDLEQDNRQLKANARRMRDYAKQVDKLTTENEILNAKIHIHGETGNLLYSAVHSMGDNATEDDREQTLRLWKQTTQLLQTDTAIQESNSFDDLRDTAQTIGITLILDGELPEEKTEKQLCEAIAHECLTNTARHAHGNQVLLRIESTESSYIIRCSNNGTPPSKPIQEGGGLSSLRRQLENHGAVLRIDSLPAFCLTAILPKEEMKNGTDPCIDC